MEAVHRAADEEVPLMSRVTIRSFAAAALAVVLAATAVPAVQALPADDGAPSSVPADLWQLVSGWIDSLFAASGTESEAGPYMDPDGPQAGPEMDPNGLDAGPEMDPDGGESDAGPHMDPDG